MSDDEDLIRRKAFELWEAEGRPDGRSEEFWEQAKASLAAGAEKTAGRAPRTRTTATRKRVAKAS
jgi:hypothetical protein